MRVRFHEGGELALDALIEEWWVAFRANTENITANFKRQNEFDLMGFMQRYLSAIDSRLMWEFGPPLKGGTHRLVITPESEHHLRPLVSRILARAPSDIGWEFYPARVSEPQFCAMTVEGRTGLSVDGWMVSITRNDRLGVEFVFIPRADQASSDQLQAAATIAAETLFGEEVLNTWCDDLRVVAPPKTGFFSKLLGRTPEAPPKDAVPLSAALERLETVLRELREALPASTLLEEISQERATWSLLQLTPQEREDYPHQTDLLVARTPRLELWQRAHGGGVFSSRRFSRCDETFCFLKIDGRNAVMDFQDKAAIEDALAPVLAREGLGAVIGGGTGLRYSYIDLALTDVERAIPLIRGTLRAGKIVNRSWLQFFDDSLAAEWVGMWPDTPPPPGLPE